MLTTGNTVWLAEVTNASDLKSCDFGVTMVVTSQSGGNQPRGAITDRTAVDAHHRQHGLARRGYERFRSKIMRFRRDDGSHVAKRRQPAQGRHYRPDGRRCSPPATRSGSPRLRTLPI